MKDSAALLHISLHRENTLHIWKIAGGCGYEFKKEYFYLIIYESTDIRRLWVFLVTQNTQPIAVVFGLLRSFAAIFF